MISAKTENVGCYIKPCQPLHITRRDEKNKKITKIHRHFYNLSDVYEIELQKELFLKKKKKKKKGAM